MVCPKLHSSVQQRWDSARAPGPASAEDKLVHSAWSQPSLRHEPQEEAERGPGSEHLLDLAAPPLARWGVARTARPSCWAARPACPRVASASCPSPSADPKLFGKLAPNPPPSVSKASLGYLLVLLQINLQVFKVTRALGACKNVSFRHILLKLKI